MAAGSAGLGMAGWPGIANLAGAQSKVLKWSKPKVFVWSGAVDAKKPIADVEAHYQELRGRGVDGVFLSGLAARDIDAIRASGMEAHIWMWTTNRGDAWIRENHPDWYMVSRSGKSCYDKPPYVDYYRWVSPVIPGVRTFLEEKVDEIVSHEGVSGVHLDYVRYPDVILPKALWKTYGLDQSEELADYDFCYGPHTREAFKKVSGRDPLEIADPAHDQEWLHFRYDSVTKLVEALVKVAHDREKPCSAAVFPTPRMARTICRQAWDRWPLDFAAPMIYHSFYDEQVPWIGERVLEDIHAVRFPVLAGLYMPAFSSPEGFADAVRLVMRRGGAGVSLFGGVGEVYWDALRGVFA